MGKKVYDSRRCKIRPTLPGTDTAKSSKGKKLHTASPARRAANQVPASCHTGDAATSHWFWFRARTWLPVRVYSVTWRREKKLFIQTKPRLTRGLVSENL
jgi:hypothetical protein